MTIDSIANLVYIDECPRSHDNEQDDLSSLFDRFHGGRMEMGKALVVKL